MKPFAFLLPILLLAGCGTIAQKFERDADICGNVDPSVAIAVEHHTAPKLRLIALGDAGDAASPSHSGFPPRLLAAAIRDLQPIDAILILGDNFYPCGAATPHDFETVYGDLSRLGIPMYAILGNHDYGDGDRECIDPSLAHPHNQLGEPVAHWHMPSRNYAEEWDGLATVVMTDTEPVRRHCPVVPAQLAELQRAIANASGWKIVAGHHALRSGGPHGRNPNDGGVMRAAYEPILNGVADLYLSGHDHHLQIVAGARKPAYVVSGGASRGRPAIGRNVVEDYGFAIVDVDPSTLRVRLYSARSHTFGPELVLTH